MKFNPAKPFGTIGGISSLYPSARYEQDGFIYNARHKCLNPAEAEEKSKSDLVAEATEKLLAKKSEELKTLTEEVVQAQANFKEEATAANKGKLTKLTNKYETLVSEIEQMGG